MYYRSSKTSVLTTETLKGLLIRDTNGAVDN